MQKVAILGATGSVGTNSLDVISRFPDRFKVSMLSTHSNIGLLLQEIKKFSPEAVCISDTKKAQEFKNKYNIKGIKIYEGDKGLCEALKERDIDVLIVGIVGSSALLPILTAISRVKKIALANKEALVMAGNIIMKKANQNNVQILPVDSEHSAIFQCLERSNNSEIKQIYLTGSGGPLLNVPKAKFKDISVKTAINHPKWKMGKKISIDSATMMNKGLEVIEAHWLFNVGIERIKILIHPETIIHSMVEFIDGSILAQMADCDMKMPIQYALTYPERLDSSVKRVDFSKVKNLNFFRPDFGKFPCLRLAYEAAEKGRTYPCVLNASNEVAVAEFLNRRIRFTDIPKVIEKVLGLHKDIKNPELEDILETDKWARIKARELLS